MDIITFFDKTCFPIYAREVFENLINSPELSRYSEYVDKLADFNLAESAYNDLIELLGNDPDNLKITALELKACLIAYDKYKQLNISDEIYFSTMRFFAKFVDYYYKKNGKIGFNRAFWAWRHTSLRLFRLGTFEYEYTEYDGRNVISLHIPKDAILKEKEMTDSFKFAKDFTLRFFPDRINDDIITESWLVSPNLKQFLNENSNILYFMNKFEIKKTLPIEGAIRFLFEIDHTFDLKKIDLKNLPENTSLQRAVKRYYLEGGRVGSGYGVLKK